ncbi:MAG: hypothetical protein H6Q14_2289 [Bacteroidetes bacterium]|nr:hypothetical protein [Bacteroidota bacterium]
MSQESNRVSRLIKGTFIYAIGNIGSKLIMVLMLPLYTYFLSKEDFGYYDLSMTILFLSISFVTLDLRDGVFRFLLHKQDEDHFKQVISSAFTVIWGNSFIVTLLTTLLNFFYPIQYFPYLLLTLLSYCVFDVQVQALRGINKTLAFVQVNILSAFLACGLCFILLKYGELGIRSFYIANIVSRLVCIVYIEWRVGFFSLYYSWKSTFPEQIQALLKYTLPLIPGVACWWLISSSCRLFITHFLGFEENGVFAIALRFSDMLFLISIIFYQSWQEIAIREYRSKDKDVFFSKVFNQYFFILVFLALAASFFIKVFFDLFIGAAYSESLLYICLMLASVVFTGMSAFLDLGYQCSLQSSKSLPSIVSATLLNLILNFILIGYFHLYGAVFSSILTYLYLFVYRIVDTRRYFKIRVSPLFFFALFSLCCGIFIYYCVDNKIILFLMGAICFVAILLVTGRKTLMRLIQRN